MTSTIKIGRNKGFLCRIGLHRWVKWRRVSIMSSNFVDLERRCLKCGQTERKTVPRDFEYGYDD